MTFQVGEYRAVRLLGHGASERIWLGEHATDGTAVVLTMFAPEQSTTCRREAELASSVDHPHLIGTLGVAVGDDRLAIVNRYAHGGSLQDVLAAAPLTPGQTVTVLAAITAALAGCHDIGLVHGGLSPAHIVFAADGKPLLASLGAVQAALEAGVPARLAPPYVCPELARGGAPTADGDMFALGSVALHCLTGYPAWPAQDLRDVVIQATLGQWPDPARAAGASDVLVWLIRQMLSDEPARRPSAAAVLRELRRAEPPLPLDLPDLVAGVQPAPAGAPELPQPGEGGPVAGQPPPGAGISWLAVAAAPSWSFVGADSTAESAADGAADDADSADGEPLLQVGASHGEGEHPEPAVLADIPRRGPGRHVRPGRPGPPGRGDRPAAHRRRAATSLIVVVAVTLIAGGSVALGLWWARIDTPDSAAELTAISTLVHPADMTNSGGLGTTTDTPAGTGSAGAAPDLAGTAAGEANWLAVIRNLDRLRSSAFTNRDPNALGSVYEPGSDALSADSERIADLAAAGYRVDGVEHDITAVVRLDQPGFVLIVTDSLPSYSIRDNSGAVVGRTGPRAAGSRTVRLIQVDDGYRIASVS